MKSAAKYKSGRSAKYAETLVDDDDTASTVAGREEGLSISATTFISGGRQTAFPGGPFSALISSMCPQDVLSKLQRMEESRDQPEFRYDEFGFKVEVREIFRNFKSVGTCDSNIIIKKK